MNQASPSVIPHGWLINPSSLMENTWRPHSLFISGFSWCDAKQREHLVWSHTALKGSLHQKAVPLRSPLATDCYLAFQWRLAVPSGEQECACQQECIGGNRGRWRMVSSCCRCVSLCVKMSPLIQPPPLPLSEPSLCLLSLFVSEMIPSVMSKATLSYSCCLGNQHWARQRLKAFMVFEAGTHERLSVELGELDSWHVQGSYCWNLFLCQLNVFWETPRQLLL